MGPLNPPHPCHYLHYLHHAIIYTNPICLYPAMPIRCKYLYKCLLNAVIFAVSHLHLTTLNDKNIFTKLSKIPPVVMSSQCHYLRCLSKSLSFTVHYHCLCFSYVILWLHVNVFNTCRFKKKTYNRKSHKCKMCFFKPKKKCTLSHIIKVNIPAIILFAIEKT